MSTIVYALSDRTNFFKTIDSIKYRNQDIKEAFDFGCSSIKNCYEKADHRFAKYYIVYEDELPIVTVMLQRNGHIIFFISDNIQNNLGLIRTLKDLAESVTQCCGAIITKTATWYTEAQRLNKLIGFKPYQVYDYYGLYVKE